MSQRRMKAIVIGAGAGGLAAAIDLARSGAHVTVIEKDEAAGGKMRRQPVGNVTLDAGPTVFTMRWIFDELFADAGKDFGDALRLNRARLLARHAWRAGGRLDLFSDVEESAAAIEAFSGAEDAQGYRRFAARSASIFETLRDPFIKDQRPSELEVVSRVGLFDMPAFLANIRPMTTLWRELHRYFKDPRLVQLFGRYATYVGSSPFQTPATIMLVAHAERDGVWSVDGGMAAVADALRGLAENLGAAFSFGRGVKRIIAENGRATGVELDDGERLEADTIVFNGDISALASGLLGEDAKRAGKETPRAKRSLSAVTACLVARARGFPIAHHTVFFDDDYPSEFRSVFEARALPGKPTVYLCAQDRGGADPVEPDCAERIFLLMNAPPDGDATEFDAEAAYDRAIDLLSGCGLSLDVEDCVLTSPNDFAARYPATGGALYGQTSHGMMGTLARAGAATKIPGLYMAGGSVHPGPGVPMAVMSGRLAARRAIADLS
ncbi:MAG: 1-hydroxycarotenoid 3,4-desaturase CrtD [Pseudomonadota bacterium]